MLTSGRLAVYDKPKAPFELKSFPIRAPRADEVLVKIRMSTICRSDIHSYLGHRRARDLQGARGATRDRRRPDAGAARARQTVAAVRSSPRSAVH